MSPEQQDLSYFIDPIYASILQEHGEWFSWWKGQMTKTQY
ncbi:hypothetical protein HMPREF9412_0305 [Paenibacillus sp. HGF5]|nr:hypothetical protein HMPREF9412_0305 [Paenibacillus sp. HGF5]